MGPPRDGGASSARDGRTGRRDDRTRDARRAEAPPLAPPLRGGAAGRGARTRARGVGPRGGGARRSPLRPRRRRGFDRALRTVARGGCQSRRRARPATADLRALRRTAVTAPSGLRPLPVTRSALTVAAYMQRRRRKRRRCSAAPARSANSGINHLW